MYKLELDLAFYFTPLMHENGRGITVTRTIELPFPPFPGLTIAGGSIDCIPEPLGFKLKEITWDVDRQVFLARTSTVHYGEPIGMIPSEIRDWLGRGWHLGSYMDAYTEEDVEEEETVEDLSEPYYWDDVEQWETMGLRDRSRGFNLLFRAMIRTMVELDNNVTNAYAMDRTKRFFEEEKIKDNPSRAAQKWQEAVQEFINMDEEPKKQWSERVKRGYPRLDRIIEGTWDAWKEARAQATRKELENHPQVIDEK